MVQVENAQPERLNFDIQMQTGFTKGVTPPPPPPPPIQQLSMWQSGIVKALIYPKEYKCLDNIHLSALLDSRTMHSKAVSVMEMKRVQEKTLKSVKSQPRCSPFHCVYRIFCQRMSVSKSDVKLMRGWAEREREN